MQLLGNFRPHPQQEAFFRSAARFRVLSAGARAGKTAAATAAWVQGIYEHLAAVGPWSQDASFNRRARPRALHWCVAPNYSLLQEAIRYTHDYIPESLRLKWFDSELTMWLRGGACLQFKSADNPESLVSVALDSLLVDEGARVPADAWRGQLRQRLVDKRGRAIFATTPLGGRGNWIYTDLIQKAGKNPDIEAFRFRASDNPYLAIEELEAQRRELPERYAKREIDGEWESWQGSVYDEFDERVHVVTRQQVEAEYKRPLDQIGQRAFAGLDWGFVAPTAVVAVVDTGRELLAVDEVYASHLPMFDAPRTVVTECKRLMNAWQCNEFYCDPEDARSSHDLSTAGVNVRGAAKAVDSGIRRVAERLHVNSATKRPALRVLSNCKNLIREMHDYVWYVTKQGEAEDRPDPRCSDHALDALRYAVYSTDRLKGYDGGLTSGPRVVRDASQHMGTINAFGGGYR